MQLLSVVAAIGLVISHTLAHDGPHEHVSGHEIARRAGMSKRCVAAVASMNKKRWAKRNLARRSAMGKRGNSSVVITTDAPYYETLKNDTCVLAPEITAGPYIWPQSQTLRQDMAEDQEGIPMLLDIGVLDMATCEPLSNALVDLWHCNATGSYSSYTALDPNSPFAQVLLDTNNMNLSDYVIGTSDVHTDNTTWLRGMWPTDQNGVMEMKTIVPGFYIERTIHIHVQVHTNWTLHRNGTLSSKNTISTGQLYMNETVSQQLMSYEPYVGHTEINRTRNADDSFINQGFAGGYNPVMDLVPLDGEDLANGVVAYITIGVDTKSLADGLRAPPPDNYVLVA